MQLVLAHSATIIYNYVCNLNPLNFKEPYIWKTKKKQQSL